MKYSFNDVVKHFNKILFKPIFSGIDCWCAGGAVRDYLLGETPKDYDIYFSKVSELNLAKERLRSLGANLRYESENGIITVLGDKEIQLIKILRKDPKQTIDSFDLTVCCVAVDKNRFYGSSDNIIQILRKELNIHKPADPVQTLWRLTKFCSRGYSLDKGEFLKLLKMIDPKNTTNEEEDYPEEENPSRKWSKLGI